MIGVLTSKSTLVLPGGTFRSSDRARLAAWVDKLRSEGIEALTAPTGAFGLTPKQLVRVHDALASKSVDQIEFQVLSRGLSN